MLHIVIIHSYRVGVINADNKMITLAHTAHVIGADETKWSQIITEHLNKNV